MGVARLDPHGGGVDTGLLEETLHHPLLVRQREGDDGTGLPGAGRATRAVEIVLVVARRVDLEDETDIVDVDAAGGDIGGDEHRDPTLTEGAEHPVADSLRKTSVEGGGEDATLPQLTGDPVGAELRAGEDDRRALTVGDLGGDGLLVLGIDQEHVVTHRRHGGLRVVGRVGDRVGHVLLDEGVDAAVQGGGEEQSLTTLGDGVEDARHLLDEAHVGHVVGLVEDGDLDLVEVDGTAIHEVDESARGGNEQVDALGQRIDLLVVGQPAGDQLVPQAADMDQRLEGVADLHGELTGRDEHEGAGPLGLPLGAVTQTGDRGQAEGQGLAGAGSATAEDIAPGERIGDGRGLDREGLGDAVAGQSLDEQRGQAEGGEAVVGRHLRGTSLGLRRVCRPAVGLGALRLALLEGHLGLRREVAALVAIATDRVGDALVARAVTTAVVTVETPRSIVPVEAAGTVVTLETRPVTAPVVAIEATRESPAAVVTVVTRRALVALEPRRTVVTLETPRPIVTVEGTRTIVTLETRPVTAPVVPLEATRPVITLETRRTVFTVVATGTVVTLEATRAVVPLEPGRTIVALEPRPVTAAVVPLESTGALIAVVAARTVVPLDTRRTVVPLESTGTIRGPIVARRAGTPWVLGIPARRTLVAGTLLLRLGARRPVVLATGAIGLAAVVGLLRALATLAGLGLLGG